MKLTWHNLNRRQREHVILHSKKFDSISDNKELDDLQKELLFLEHYNELLKGDYTSFVFPTSVPKK